MATNLEIKVKIACALIKSGWRADRVSACAISIFNTLKKSEFENKELKENAI